MGWGSTSPEKDFRVPAGDTAPVDLAVSVSVVVDMDLEAFSDPFVFGLVADSPGVGYKHSLSDFVQVKQRGRSSSHLTLLLRQVRLG